jgi:hypothetical protein
MDDGQRTSALLLAGRVLDQYFPTVGHVLALRRLAEPRGLTVVVAGDETYRGAPSQPDDSLHARVAIGVPIVVVTADDSPLGPINLVAVTDALERVQAVGQLWWRSVARELGPSPMFTAEQRKASLPERLRRAFEGVAFDGPDLARTEDRIHLVAAGPLASALLARGKLGELPVDEDGDLDLESLDGWVRGQRSNQDPPVFGVEGEEIAGADILDLGTQAVAVEVFGGGFVYLMVRYD